MLGSSISNAVTPGRVTQLPCERFLLKSKIIETFQQTMGLKTPVLYMNPLSSILASSVLLVCQTNRLAVESATAAEPAIEAADRVFIPVGNHTVVEHLGESPVYLRRSKCNRGRNRRPWTASSQLASAESSGLALLALAKFCTQKSFPRAENHTSFAELNDGALTRSAAAC